MKLEAKLKEEELNKVRKKISSSQLLDDADADTTTNSENL
jgi:hypothetical protein